MAMRTCIYPNLAAEMARCHHTQGDLAAILGLKQAAVSLRMSGKREWDLHEITTICKQYGREFEYLFAQEGKEFVTNSKRSIGDIEN